MPSNWAEIHISVNMNVKYHYQNGVDISSKKQLGGLSVYFYTDFPFYFLHKFPPERRGKRSKGHTDSEAVLGH